MCVYALYRFIRHGIQRLVAMLALIVSVSKPIDSFSRPRVVCKLYFFILLDPRRGPRTRYGMGMIPFERHIHFYTKTGNT